MTQVTDGIRLEVEGRVFIQQDPTFEQELFIAQQVDACGMSDLSELRLDAENDQLEPAVRHLMIRAYASGKLFLLMGSLVTEEGRDWSPALAEEQGEFFRTVRDKVSKAHLQMAMVGAVLAFFENAVRSGSTSPTSSGKSPKTPSVRPSKKPKLTPEQAAEVFRTGTMPSPSEKSATNTDSTPASSTEPGKSEKD